jgi:hypothetical protein
LCPDDVGAFSDATPGWVLGAEGRLGASVRKSRQKEAAGVCGGRGVIYGISIDFHPENLARSGIQQKGSY